MSINDLESEKENVNYKRIIEKSNFDFLFSIKKSLTILYTNKELKCLEKMQILKIANNLEWYFKSLLKYEEVDDSNVVVIGLAILHHSKELQEYILSSNGMADEKSISTIISKEIKLVSFDKINFRLYSNMGSDDDSSLNFTKLEDIKTCFLDLIDLCQYTYSDYMEKEIIYFLERYYKNSQLGKSNKIKFSKKRMIYFLNNFNSIFESIHYVFLKKGTFNCNFLEKYYTFNTGVFSLKFFSFFLEDPYIKEYKVYLAQNLEKLVHRISSALKQMREYYTIEYKDLNTFNDTTFVKTEDNITALSYISRHLEEENIFNLLSLKTYKLSEIHKNSDLKRKIDLIIGNLHGVQDINIISQFITSHSLELVKEIKQNISIYKEKYHDFNLKKVVTLNKIHNKINEIISIPITYKGINFEVHISQYNRELFSYIYKDEEYLIKDRILRADDFERVFYFIEEIYVNLQ